MTFIPPQPVAMARHLICLDLVAGELQPEDPRRPAAFRRPIDNAARVLRHARAFGWAVTHVHRRGLSGPAARPVEGLEPLPTERLLYRTGVSAFSNQTFRRTIQAEGGELLILGLSLSAACLTTALTAHDWNMKVTLLEDAIQPTLALTPEINVLHTVARSMALPFVRIARVENVIGPRAHLRLVPTA